MIPKISDGLAYSRIWCVWEEPRFSLGTDLFGFDSELIVTYENYEQEKDTLF